MAIFPRDIFTALKAELQGASSLSYVDTITIQQYRPSMLPDFDTHAIIISPEAATSETYPAAQKWIRYEITLVCLVRVLHSDGYTLEDAIIGNSPGDSPPNVGILTMYQDLYELLFQNNLGGVIEHYPGLKELDTRCDFRLVGDESREDFIVESRIYYNPYGQRFVTPT